MKCVSLTERAKQRLFTFTRFIVLIPMVGIGNQIRLYVHEVWTDYWLTKDGKTTSAVITQVHPKRVFDYRYTLNGREYAGTSTRDWEDEKDHGLQAGEKTTVFFSASHPWLSSLQMSRDTWAGFPFVALMLLVELFCLAVLIDPKGRWAVSRWLLNSKNQERN